MSLLWLAVLVFHARARWVGGGWMLFGIVAYVVYRRFVERTSLTKRGLGARRRRCGRPCTRPSTGTSWCRSSAPKLDDDIVSTAGRLADAADEPGEERPKLEVIYVFEQPLTVPLDAPPPKERMEAAEAALRAGEGGGGGVRVGGGRDRPGAGAHAGRRDRRRRRGGATSS